MWKIDDEKILITPMSKAQGHVEEVQFFTISRSQSVSFILLQDSSQPHLRELESILQPGRASLHSQGLHNVHGGENESYEPRTTHLGVYTGFPSTATPHLQKLRERYVMAAIRELERLVVSFRGERYTAAAPFVLARRVSNSSVDSQGVARLNSSNAASEST